METRHIYSIKAKKCKERIRGCILFLFLLNVSLTNAHPRRIIMNFVDCDDIEGFGEHAYTLSDKGVLFDGDEYIIHTNVLYKT